VTAVRHTALLSSTHHQQMQPINTAAATTYDCSTDSTTQIVVKTVVTLHSTQQWQYVVVCSM